MRSETGLGSETGTGMTLTGRSSHAAGSEEEARELVGTGR